MAPKEFSTKQMPELPHRRIPEGLHLPEYQNTGFKKIMDAPRPNGSPLPEFVTNEAHDYLFLCLQHVKQGADFFNRQRVN